MASEFAPSSGEAERDVAHTSTSDKVPPHSYSDLAARSEFVAMIREAAAGADAQAVAERWLHDKDRRDIALFVKANGIGVTTKAGRAELSRAIGLAVHRSARIHEPIKPLS
jgi:hypothetical protein